MQILCNSNLSQFLNLLLNQVWKDFFEDAAAEYLDPPKKLDDYGQKNLSVCKHIYLYSHYELVMAKALCDHTYVHIQWVKSHTLQLQSSFTQLLIAYRPKLYPIPMYVI